MNRPAASAVLLTIAALAACGRADRVARANDALRLERDALTARVQELEALNAEQRVKLEEHSARADSPLPPDVLEALPRAAGLGIGRFSLITNSDSGPHASLLIAPTDGRGRFVQVVATLRLRVVEAANPPRVLGERVLTPAELRDSLTAGLTGAAYRVQVQLEQTPALAALVTAELHDHITGATLTAERTLPPQTVDR